ncbi:MAG: 6-phosphogluconolactonase, partial [Plesiomonas shigelloides]
MSVGTVMNDTVPIGQPTLTPSKENMMAISVPVFKEFAGAQALNSQLAERIAQALQQGVDERGAASLVVSGGRTPIALFSELSQ